MPAALPIRTDHSPAALRTLVHRGWPTGSATAGSAPGSWRSQRARGPAAGGGGAPRRHDRPDAAGRGAPLQRRGAGRAARSAPPGPPPRPRRGPAGDAEGLGAARGPDPERDGCGEWRIRDLCRLAEDRFGVAYAETGMPRLVRSLGLSWQKARPRHPGASPAEQARFKGGLPGRLAEAAAAHPEAGRVELWFMDEARVGRKGRTTHVRYEKGVRPRGARDIGFASTRLLGAACPERGEAVALVLPEVSTKAMGLFLTEVGRRPARGTHAVLVLDRAGRHTSRGLEVPPNLKLVHPPPYAPELNPVEKLWQFLRERFLSRRVFRDPDAVAAAACAAWNRLVAEPGRVRSLTSFPWLPPSVVTS